MADNIAISCRLGGSIGYERLLSWTSECSSAKASFLAGTAILIYVQKPFDALDLFARVRYLLLASYSLSSRVVLV